jgi:hypothetical protein
MQETDPARATTEMSEDGQLGGKIEGCCQLCEKGSAKYRCPGCDVQTCSVVCVRDHKTVSGCTGKRSRAGLAYLPASQLTPKVLLDDYCLLEEATQSSKMLSRVLPRSRPRNQHLVKQCALRNICLSLMPTGMKRAKQNRTSLQGQNITWTVEWIVLEGVEEHPATMKIDDLRPFITKTAYSQCPESETLLQSYSRKFANSDAGDTLPFTLLLKQEADKDSKISPVDISPTRRLWPVHSPNITWQLLLANRTIVEFPTVYIYRNTP